MTEAIRLAAEGVETGKGGPFGAVIVLNGAIVGKGCNMVTSENDPTAHAEIQAIRAACQHLQDYTLKGAQIYTSCEPCPMCLAAIYWARIDAIFYAADQQTATTFGFDDSYIYEQVPLAPENRLIKGTCLQHQLTEMPFITWRNKADKKLY